MKFYLLTLIYIILALVTFFLPVADDMQVTLIALFTVFFVLIVITGVSVIRMNLFFTSINKLSNNKSEIALTFDDGPHKELTPRVLDLLAKYNAKATFFCIGNKIESNKDLVKRMVDEGHSIGNHTFEHSAIFPILSVKKMVASIFKTDEAFRRIGVPVSGLFRPPYGVTNNLLAIALKRLNKKSIGWNIRTKDTCKSKDKVVKLVKKNIKPGSVILMHDTNPNICDELVQILEYSKQLKLKSIAL